MDFACGTYLQVCTQFVGEPTQGFARGPGLSWINLKRPKLGVALDIPLFAASHGYNQ